jgi:membrane protease YdiL (CAAX protease family)
MNIIFLLLILVYYAVGAILFVRKLYRFDDIVITEKIRTNLYKYTIIEGWIPALCIFVICTFSNIGINDIGLRLFYFKYNIWFNVIVLTIIGGYSVLLIYQMISYMVSKKFREKAKEQLENGSQKSRQAAIVNSLFFPRTKMEKRLWFFVSLTAGFCEELVFRGFLFFILLTIFPNLSIIIVLIVGSVIFGHIHSYQGFSGIIKTTISGALFGCLYLATGSLIPGMIFHFIGDLAAAFILSEE